MKQQYNKETINLDSQKKNHFFFFLSFDFISCKETKESFYFTLS